MYLSQINIYLPVFQGVIPAIQHPAPGCSTRIVKMNICVKYEQSYTRCLTAFADLKKVFYAKNKKIPIFLCHI